jgi:hypothetical protein
MNSYINTKRRISSINMNNKSFYNNLISKNKTINPNDNSSSLFKKINKAFQKDKDKDKMNLENSNLFSYFHKPNYKYFYDRKKFKSIPNKKINKCIKSKDFLEQSINSFNNTELLFKNKFIRDNNKNQFIQINSIGPEITIHNLLKAKDNDYKSKYQIIKDNNYSHRFDKNKILYILKTQTQSNFNNKYKLIFQSSNINKRNSIRKYFSLIKKNLKEEFKTVETPTNNIYQKNDIYIKKDISLFKKNINKTPTSHYKLKSNKILRTIPVIINSKIKEKINGEKDMKYKNCINSNKNDYNEINETISFYSTKNPIFQTETNLKKRYYYNSSLKIQK